MWRLWTRGWGVRGWWQWVTDATPRQIAWWLPHQIALWAFIRVYAHTGDAPGPEYTRVYDAWEHRRNNGRP